MEPRVKGKQGLASMGQEQRRRIAQMGGRIAALSPKKYHWTPETARAASLKGIQAKREKARASSAAS